MQAVRWGEYRLGDLFEQYRGKEKAPNQCEEGDCPLINETSTNNGFTRNVKPTKIFKGNAITISINYASTVFYQKDDFCASVNISILKNDKILRSEEVAMFFISLIKLENAKYNYALKISKDKINDTIISLPIKSRADSACHSEATAEESRLATQTLDVSPAAQHDIQDIDFDFMESFIRELEEERIRELQSYLAVTGLQDYTLTAAEQTALNTFDSLEWQEFNVESLFGKSTRGKRLKGDDRIEGDLPFVTAGEADTGISAFISNDVEIFSANTTTIDMFGSAKYRNYDYGADDHVAVVHTEKLPKYAAIFVTTACHKSAHNGQFNYGHNFYAKDADELYISLPVRDDKPDFDAMDTFISAVQKLVIKDVVKYADEKIAATKKAVEE